jgi:hypothetical protein
LQDQFENYMKRAVTVSESTLSDEGAPSPALERFPVWVEVVNWVLVLAGVWASWPFWTSWLSEPDHMFFLVCVIAGVGIALARGAWQGPFRNQRLVGLICLWSLAAVFIALGLLTGLPSVPVFALGLVLMAWVFGRVAGEHFAFAVSLGLVLLSPAVFDWIGNQGGFETLQMALVSMTSGLAETFGQSNIREGFSVVFGQGIADRFPTSGTLDSVGSFLGIGLFLILAGRRNLVPALFTLVASVLVWLAVHACSWTLIAWLASRDGNWIEWNLVWTLGVLGVGILLLTSVDHFVATLFDPIPFEFVNVDFPLFALIWNWVCGLPTLVVRMPLRETDFGPMEMDDEVNSR